MSKRFYSYAALLICCLYVASSCAPSRNAYYFHGLEPSTTAIDSVLKVSVQRIQIGDRLSVVMSTKNQAENEILNPLGIVRGGGGNGGSNTIIGYQVNQDSTIELPVIGIVKVQGLTTEEAAQVIKERVALSYKDPYVNVNLLGRVVVLGTRSPGVVALFNERLTIFEAMAQSGEAEPAARRDRVWIVREQNGERTTALINLNSPEIFNSPYYYLRTNDLIYLEPNRLGSFLGVNAPVRTLFAVVTGVASIILAFLITNL